MNILAKGDSMLPTLKDGQMYNIELMNDIDVYIGI